MKRFKLFFFVSLLVTLGSVSWADVPRLINFQGRLGKDTLGTPVKDSTYSILFTIYNAAAGGINLWSETQSVVTKGGTFSVNLGSVTALPDSVFDDTTRYLAMKVGTDAEMTPRQRIVSMAYGYRVRTVDGATGGIISGDVNIQSDLTVSGNVGIGTTSPTKRLEVAGSIKVGTSDTVFSSNISSNSPLSLQAPAGTTRMFINDANGRVGIGTMTPNGTLHIKGPSDVNRPVLEVENSVNGWYSIQLKRAPDSTFDYFIGRAPTSALGGRALVLHVPTAAFGYGGIGSQPKIAFLSSNADILGTAEAFTGNWYFKGNVGIGTTSAQGALDVSSTTGAFIVPRMTTTQRDALTAVNGMIIYNTTTDQFNFREAGAWVTK